jgi:hypothetical protein
LDLVFSTLDIERTFGLSGFLDILIDYLSINFYHKDAAKTAGTQERYCSIIGLIELLLRSLFYGTLTRIGIVVLRGLIGK